MPTLRETAVRIGCGLSTVYRVARRLNIDHSGGQISAAAAATLARQIQPGRRGHWQRGRRRHAVEPSRHQRVLQQLRTLLDTRARRGVISVRALAEHVRVSDRSVRRWLSEEDIPDARTLQSIDAWVQRMTRDSRAG